MHCALLVNVNYKEGYYKVLLADLGLTLKKLNKKIQKKKGLSMVCSEFTLKMHFSAKNEYCIQKTS